MLHNSEQLQAFWSDLSDPDPEAFMAEAFVPFERELAVIAARSVTGEPWRFTPVIETYQQDQVCHWAMAPVALAPETQQQIETIVTLRSSTICRPSDCLGLSFFLTADGQVLVNEDCPPDPQLRSSHLRCLCHLTVLSSICGPSVAARWGMQS